MSQDQSDFIRRQQDRIDHANRQRAASTVTVHKTTAVGKTEFLPQALRGLGLDRAFSAPRGSTCNH